MFEHFMKKPSGESGGLVFRSPGYYWTSSGAVAPRAAERQLSTYHSP